MAPETRTVFSNLVGADWVIDGRCFVYVRLTTLWPDPVKSMDRVARAM